MKPEDIVFLSLTEEKDFLSWFNSGKSPSSEWRFHQDIYKNKWEAKAIVHAHSPHATAVSTHVKSIPPFHYMIALAGGDDIKCAEYATFGTKELSKNVIKALIIFVESSWVPKVAYSEHLISSPPARAII